MKLLKNAIFDLSLRKGSLILGWLSLCIGIPSLISGIGQLCSAVINYEAEYRRMNMYPDDRVLDENDFRIMSHQKISNICGAIMVILFSSTCCIFSGLFLIGVYKQKPRFMIPAITVSGLGLLFLALSAFYGAFYYSGIDREVFQMMVFLFGAYYCFLIIYSHYKELREAKMSNNNLSHQILSHEQIMAVDAPVKPATQNIA